MAGLCRCGFGLASDSPVGADNAFTAVQYLDHWCWGLTTESSGRSGLTPSWWSCFHWPRPAARKPCRCSRYLQA